MPYEGAKDGKHYWLTPPDLLEQLNQEFHFDTDPCPFPKPEDYDGLLAEWGWSSYVNPPFKGPTAWVKKCISEIEKGKKVVFVFPMPKWALMLLTHPNLKEVRNLKDVKWCATEDGKPGKGIGQHIACFVLGSKQETDWKQVADELAEALYIIATSTGDCHKDNIYRAEEVLEIYEKANK